MPAKKKTARRKLRTRRLNPDATTANIPCLKSEKSRWEKAAQEEARSLGLSRLPFAEWARKHLNKASDPTRADVIDDK